MPPPFLLDGQLLVARLLLHFWPSLLVPLLLMLLSEPTSPSRLLWPSPLLVERPLALAQAPLPQALPQAPLRVLRRWRLWVVPAPLALAQAPLVEPGVGRPLHHL